MIHGDQKDRDFLRRYIESLIGAINAIGEPHAGRQLPIPIIEKTYLDLIRRIKASLMGILAQLDYWPEYAEMKVPISLLFRLCMTDVLLILYLSSIQGDEPTFENELSLLDKPYVRFVETLIKEGQLTKSGEEKDEALQNLYEKADYLIKQVVPKVEFKNNASMRATSIGKHQNLSESLTIDYQFKHISAHSILSSLSNLYWMYKHFSQHEHYSRAGSVYIHFPQSFECVQWHKALIGCFEAIKIIGKTLGASDILIEDLHINVGHLYQRLTEHQEE